MSSIDSPFSLQNAFWAILICLLQPLILSAAPTHLVEEPVVAHQRLEDGHILLDFGKVSFGNLKVKMPEKSSDAIKFHFGEAMKEGRVDRKPPGSVRYGLAEVSAEGSLGGSQVVAPPAIGWNTRKHSTVQIPEEFGVVLPFRWVEIEGWLGAFDPVSIIRQTSYLKAWDDDAASFECSDPLLNRIWDLSKYSIKATSFAGIYVDGERERIPYEADAYLNQLSHYYTDTDKQLARDTFDWLMVKPTWPTEWASHMIFMAYADWQYTGDAAWLKPRYDALKAKLLFHRVDESGWVRSYEEHRNRVKGSYWERDIVDWPRGERDGYVFTEVNTVVNAFQLKSLLMMAELGEAIGRKYDAKTYLERYENGVRQFNEALWMADKGCYRDGIETDHASAHATFFPLAFGLVPEDYRDAAVAFLKTKGMACSVYAAQYLMEALFENGAEDYALQLITAESDRSWKHMVESGTTITWEAWDQKYKPNQDWNHAWGAAPANLLPRYILGVEPILPGWKKASIAPKFVGLQFAKGKVPTAFGPLEVSWERSPEKIEIVCVVPQGMTAEVSIPNQAVNGDQLILNSAEPVPLATFKQGENLIFNLKEGKTALRLVQGR